MNVRDNTVLRRTLLFGVPGCYFALMCLHPTENPVPGDDVGFWMFIHVVQLALIGGMACVIWVLTAGDHGRAARTARAFILPYVITYSAFDAIAGLAAGDMVRVANEVDPADRAAADRFVDQMMEAEPAGIVFYIVVGLCWLGAMGATVISLRTRIPTGAFVLLALGTVIFAVGHPRPFGPVAMGLILAGMLWLELRPKVRPIPLPATNEGPILAGSHRAH